MSPGTRQSGLGVCVSCARNLVGPWRRSRPGGRTWASGFMSCKLIGRAPNMIGIFPAMCVEEYCGEMGTGAVSATGRMMNGTLRTLGIWSYITSCPMSGAVRTSRRT